MASLAAPGIGRCDRRAWVTGQPLADQAAALKQSQAAIGRTLADYRFLDPAVRCQLEPLPRSALC
jgi:hypothetical protein